jgi:hypothetical protein
MLRSHVWGYTPAGALRTNMVLCLAVLSRAIRHSQVSWCISLKDVEHYLASCLTCITVEIISWG